MLHVSWECRFYANEMQQAIQALPNHAAAPNCFRYALLPNARYRLHIDTIWAVHESITDVWIARGKDRDSQDPTQPPPAPPARPKATGAPALLTTEAVAARVLQTPSDKPPPRQRGDSHAVGTHDWAITFHSSRNADCGPLFTRAYFYTKLP